MKTETQQHVPLREIQRELANIVADEGGTSKAARKLGISHSMVSYILSGKSKPRGKVLPFFGLKAVTIYVRDDKPKESQ